MKLKRIYYTALVISIVSFLLIFVKKKYYKKEINIADNEIILLTIKSEKININEVCKEKKTLFLWISEKCCHQCVEKELKNIKNYGINIKLIIAVRPIRKWKIIHQQFNLDNFNQENLFCLYNLYSFVEEETLPYYFLYNKNTQTISALFFPDRYNEASTFEYFNNIEKNKTEKTFLNKD